MCVWCVREGGCVCVVCEGRRVGGCGVVCEGGRVCGVVWCVRKGGWVGVVWCVREGGRVGVVWCVREGGRVWCVREVGLVWEGEGVDGGRICSEKVKTECVVREGGRFDQEEEGGCGEREEAVVKVRW